MAETEPSAELVSEISAAEPEIIGEPEFEPGSLPENLILIDDEHEAKSWPEPEPEWNTAFGEWGVAWPLHVYIFGIFYAVAFIFAFLCVMAIVKTIKLRKGKLTFSLLIMVILFNASRALSLFIEPYYAYGNVPFLTARIIWSIGLPFLTSSFSLVFLVLLDTTKMDIGPPKFQKVSMILTITVIHIGIVMTSDFIVFYEASAKAMLVVCQALFILYGLVLAIGYMFVGIKMRQNSTAGRLLDSSVITRLVVLCFVSSVTSAAVVATHLYGAVGVFGISETTVDPWPWWILQTFIRAEELVSMCVVLTIAMNSEQLKEQFNRLCRRKDKVQQISIKQEPVNGSVTQVESFSS